MVLVKIRVVLTTLRYEKQIFVVAKDLFCIGGLA